MITPTHQRKQCILQARQFHLTLGDQTRIMGILNLSPDSFSGDGILVKANKDLGRVRDSAEKLIQEGADLLDIGGESTRPGSFPISAPEEISRVIPAIQMLARKNAVPISIDTYKPLVARHALDAGAGIINNIMGAKPEMSLLKMVQRYDAALVLMHIQGKPRTMQTRIHYRNLVGEIKGTLRESIEKCLEIGIKSDRIIIDPGIGFGKTTAHNLELMARLGEFRSLSCPLLIGTSRKSFIGRVLKKDIPDRLMGTVATVVCAILNGAHIIRLHDVGGLRDAIVMADSILNYKKCLL